MASAPEMTGVRKAAVLLLTLSQDEAAEVLTPFLPRRLRR